MKPFDLPPDNLDRLHAALCPPACESYLSIPNDEEDHEHVHTVGGGIVVEPEPATAHSGVVGPAVRLV